MPVGPHIPRSTPSVDPAGQEGDSSRESVTLQVVRPGPALGIVLMSPSEAGVRSPRSPCDSVSGGPFGAGWVTQSTGSAARAPPCQLPPVPLASLPSFPDTD